MSAPDPEQEGGQPPPTREGGPPSPAPTREGSQRPTTPSWPGSDPATSPPFAPKPSSIALLRRHTMARVALGRVGTAQPTVAHLAFQAAHAAARDAVWAEAALMGDIAVRSQIRDRREYLLRPDLGRRLAEGTALPLAPGALVFVVADGLCATGVAAQAPAVIAAARGLLPLPVGPVVVATQARVALGDEIGAAMGAAAVAVLIGERPGLSAQDSMGIYLTWAPVVGRTDAERNCISNVRPGGLSASEAAEKLAWLLRAAMALGATGVGLKDDMPAVGLLK